MWGSPGGEYRGHSPPTWEYSPRWGGVPHFSARIRHHYHGGGSAVNGAQDSPVVIPTANPVYPFAMLPICEHGERARLRQTSRSDRRGTGRFVMPRTGGPQRSRSTGLAVGTASLADPVRRVRNEALSTARREART